MKYLLFVSLFLILIQNIAGQNTVKLNWSNEREDSSIADNVASKYIINAENFIGKSGAYEARIIINQYKSYNGGLEIVNPKYENIDSDELKAFGSIRFSDKMISSFSTGKGRNEYIHSVILTPVICGGNGCKKLVSFEVKENLSASRNNRFISQKSFNLNKTNSLLATGSWKRIKIDTTGIYQITPQLLSSLGINPTSIDPNNVRIFGFGGKSLPLANSENQFFDPPEIAVDVVGGGDGSFDANDRVYFYGVGTRGWNEDNNSFINPYSDDAYYYISVDKGQNKKMADLVEPTNPATINFDSYDFQTFYEKDEVNIAKQGREWFGAPIDIELSRSFSFMLPERVDGVEGNITYDIRFGGDYNQRPVVTIGSNSSEAVENFTLTSVSSREYAVTDVNGGIVNNPVLENLILNLDFDKQGDPSSILYIDYITLNTRCKLQGSGRQFTFVNNGQLTGSGIAQYTINNAQGIGAIWDVSDPFNPTKKSHDNSAQASFKVAMGSESLYSVFDRDDVFSPSVPSNSNVQNQNIKGTVFENNQGVDQAIDYLIITHSSLVSAAQRLATYREGKGLRTKILTVESIYNEFSNGQQDIGAIRNVIRYVYQNAASDSERLKFVCFLGTPSYDYKNRVVGNVNLVPVFHAERGNRNTDSYPSDDFFVMLDESEGANIVSDFMDVAVGRIISSNLTIANQMIDKIVNYDAQRTQGVWKSNLTFISDDPDGSSNRDFDGQLQIMSNFSADRLQEKEARLRVNKILTDAFVQESTSAGSRYPTAEKEIVNSFTNGSLVSLYLGHGGEDGLAGETIFTSRTASSLTNEDRPNIFVTVTCVLTRFDNPVDLSAGELMFLNSRGGSVALITTVRDIFVSVALDFYPRYVDRFFDANNQPIPIGESLRLVKSEVSSSNKRSVFCIGDPALIPGLPPKGVSVDAINDDTQFNQETASKPKQVLQGLGRVTVEGSISNENGEGVDSSYNGIATISIFGKEETRSTLANDGFTGIWELDETNFSFPRSLFNDASSNPPFQLEFTVPGRLLFSGKSSVREGKYQAEFIMPRNVDELEAEGTISVYVERANQASDRLDIDSITIGGLNEDAPEDLVPPQIEIFLNDENFQDGQLVSSEPLVIVKFTDDSGINSSGGVGHDIIAIIDGDEANPVVLNEFYSSEIDDFTRGRVEYRLLGVGEGDHTLEIRVSDTYNNVASKEITFSSANSNDFDIQRVLNYPNPFTSKTGFWFSHTGSSSLELEVFVQVFTVSGKIVKSLKTQAPVRGQNTYQGVLMWDGRDDFGKKLGKGTYLYKISVKSPLMNKTVTKIEKLVIL